LANDHLLTFFCYDDHRLRDEEVIYMKKSTDEIKNVTGTKVAKSNKSKKETTKSTDKKKRLTGRKDLTEMVFILDRSGSMSGLESDTIGGFNTLLKKQKKVKGDAL
jgi:hypothetical protein